MAAEVGFSGKADIYAKARPDYSEEFLRWMFSEVCTKEDAVFADVGAGTGIFTKALLERGAKVFCIEPVPDMLEAAVKKLSAFPGFTPLAGGAEKLPLSDGSVDFVTAATAFHWFDAVKFRDECLRVLRPGGKVILVWNSRDHSSGIVRENAEICAKYCPGFHGFSGGPGYLRDTFAAFFRNGDYICQHFENNLYYDEETFVGRLISASYSPQKGDAAYDEYVAALKGFFLRLAENGILLIPNETVGYVGGV